MQDEFAIDTESLERYLSAHMPGFSGQVTATKFSQGQSNPTYLLNTNGGKYVLRKKPPGELLKSAHAVDREYRVMKALQDSDVPVPRMHLLCTDENVLGTVFYIMEYVDGRVMFDPSLQQIDLAERRAYYESMNHTLVAVHQVDLVSTGLYNYGKPKGYLQRQLSLWARQYEASKTDENKDMNRLLVELPRFCPVDDDRVALVHGDFRLDNMLFQRDSSQVMALVDWELSTLGHPFTDLAYQCMQLRMPYEGIMPGLGGCNRIELGLPDEDDYVAMYCQQIGIDKIPNWNYFLAFSFFRFAAILQGVKKRSLSGNASSEKAEQMGSYIEPLASMAVEVLYA